MIWLVPRERGKKTKSKDLLVLLTNSWAFFSDAAYPIVLTSLVVGLKVLDGAQVVVGP